MNSPYWFEVAVITSIFALGNLFFGHFEERTPKWRRVAKVFVVTALFCAVSALFGRGWFFALLGVSVVGVVVIHAWWLPRHGVNGWTAEPRERYYALRGWPLADAPRDARSSSREPPRS